MSPRLASSLMTLTLALGAAFLSLPSLPAADPATPAQPAVCQADSAAAAPALPETSPAWETRAPTCKPDECAALCAPLQGRCRSGSCICLRDPL